MQVNRRYIRGVQFGAAYTLQRARGTADEDPGNLSYSFNRPLDFFYSELAQSNRNSLIVNYSWDLPGRHTGAMRVLLDGWQVSGESDFVSGDWAQRHVHDDRQRSTSRAAKRATARASAGQRAVPASGAAERSSPIRWPAAAIR